MRNKGMYIHAGIISRDNVRYQIPLYDKLTRIGFINMYFIDNDIEIGYTATFQGKVLCTNIVSRSDDDSLHNMLNISDDIKYSVLVEFKKKDIWIHII